jgi:ferric-dicitrate binding protein FerR (iron transport regulator)
MTPAERDELRSLLDALAEEVITPDQTARLEAFILAYPEAEAEYVRFMNLLADLTREFATPPAPPVPARPVPAAPASPRRRRRLWAVALVGGVPAAAAMVLAAIALWPRPIVLSPNPRTSAPAAERVDDTVAVLLQTHRAEWEDTGMPTRPGSPLPPGRLVLKSGYAHLEFYNGATVILEGPAELRLVSRSEAYCARGKLRATVPPQAQGFALKSPGLDLIDRGTEFGVEVGGARTALHVFQGQVDVYEPGHERRDAALKVVRTGEGVSRDGPGAIRSLRPEPTSFLTPAQLAVRAEEATRQRQTEWSAAANQLRADPALKVYYSFQAGPVGSRTLRDEAGGRVTPHDGAVVGCGWGAGRWPGRAALEYRQVSDRVRLTVPGEFEALTLAAWVRPDALPNQNNALLMADGWDPGGVHWQIGIDGTLILSVKFSPEQEGGPNMRGAQYRAYGVMTADRLGQWVHLAAVYDPAAKKVTHYVDGRAVAELPIEEADVPLRFGDAELGNWNAARFRNKNPVRNFTGGIDEFLLFSRALSGAEVERLYAQGRPPL